MWERAAKGEKVVAGRLLKRLPDGEVYAGWSLNVFWQTDRPPGVWRPFQAATDEKPEAAIAIPQLTRCKNNEKEIRI
jgi:hypothetical protein